MIINIKKPDWSVDWHFEFVNPLDAKLFFFQTPVGIDLVFSMLLLGADLIFANLPPGTGLLFEPGKRRDPSLALMPVTK